MNGPEKEVIPMAPNKVYHLQYNYTEICNCDLLTMRIDSQFTWFGDEPCYTSFVCSGMMLNKANFTVFHICLLTYSFNCITKWLKKPLKFGFSDLNSNIWGDYGIRILADDSNEQWVTKDLIVHQHRMTFNSMLNVSIWYTKNTHFDPIHCYLWCSPGDETPVQTGVKAEDHIIEQLVTLKLDNVYTLL